MLGAIGNRKPNYVAPADAERPRLRRLALELIDRRARTRQSGATTMTSGKDDEEFFKARGFGIKIGFGERPAADRHRHAEGLHRLPTCRSARASTAKSRRSSR
jgi:hypothetical protein